MSSGVEIKKKAKPAICTICVRGSSKGVAKKNTRLMGGRPLLAHSLEHAKQSGLFDCIAVSSDSQEALDIAMEYGADRTVLRPAELATDTAAKPPAIRHCVETVEAQTGACFETIVDLDATSPLRMVEDIHAAVDLLCKTGVGNVITGTPAHRSPYFNMVEERFDGSVQICKPMGTITRRQDAPPCFDMNASVYVWRRGAFFEGPVVFRDDTRIYVMPAERSIDIDSELDWQIVEFLLATS